MRPLQSERSPQLKLHVLFFAHSRSVLAVVRGHTASWGRGRPRRGRASRPRAAGSRSRRCTRRRRRPPTPPLARRAPRAPRGRAGAALLLLDLRHRYLAYKAIYAAYLYAISLTECSYTTLCGTILRMCARRRSIPWRLPVVCGSVLESVLGFGFLVASVHTWNPDCLAPGAEKEETLRHR